MKLGVMQPYFFPYLGYFDVINRADKWIVFDSAQYIRHGWVNRNRILHPNEGWQYIVVPLKKHSREAPIKDVEIASGQDWAGRIIGQLGHYKNRAPYFERTAAAMKQWLTRRESSIARLNAFLLERVCELLQIPFDYAVFSDMHLDLKSIEGPGDWALRICEALGADGYVNPPGGADLFDPDQFKRAGIELTICHLPPLAYECDGYEFVPNLSIIDLLMWNSPEQIKEHLDKHGNG